MSAVFFEPCKTGAPFIVTVNQTFGPSSTEDHASDACVDPTSVTETTGLPGALVSRGSVKVTVLLYFEALPEGFPAKMRRLKLRPGSSAARQTWLEAGPGNVSLLVFAQLMV